MLDCCQLNVFSSDSQSTYDYDFPLFRLVWLIRASTYSDYNSIPWHPMQHWY